MALEEILFQILSGFILTLFLNLGRFRFPTPLATESSFCQLVVN